MVVLFPTPQMPYLSQKPEIIAPSVIIKALNKLHPKNALKKSLLRLFLNGGGGGIRTHGTRERTTVFKTAPINRSGTPPYDCSDVILLY